MIACPSFWGFCELRPDMWPGSVEVRFEFVMVSGLFCARRDPIKI